MNQYKSGISETNSTEKEEIVRIDALNKLKTNKSVKSSPFRTCL